MSPTDNKDPFGFADLFKQFADSLNEGAEQIKRVATCKMRRFYRVVQETNEEDGAGVMFPDGTAVVQEYVTGDLHIYNDIKFLNRTRAEQYDVRWVDVETKKPS